MGMSNCKKVKATFKGKDKSEGYRTNAQYLLYVNSTKHGSINIKAIGTQAITPYESITAFLNNWDNISNLHEEIPAVVKP